MMFINSLKVFGTFAAVAIIVFSLLYIVDSVETETQNEIAVNYSSNDNSETYSSNDNSETSPLYVPFLTRLNITPDYVEIDRIKSITGIDEILYFIYAALFIINIILIRSLKPYESCSIVVAFGLYSGFTLTFLLNIILFGSFTTWDFHHAFSLFLNGLGIGLLASLVSISIRSVYKLIFVLKQEGVSLLEMIADRVATPDAKASFSTAGTWSLYSVFVFILMLISIYY